MRLFFFIGFLVFTQVGIAQNNVPKKDIVYCQEIIRFLANDSLKGRPAGTRYEKWAADAILKQLKNNKGFEPQLQLFNFIRKDSSHAEFAQNIYCFIDNHAPTTILLGAHYDHLGFGEGISRSYGKKGIHNGADDNASGVALLLLLAQKFKDWSTTKYNYLFVSYSAHEIGLFGSKNFHEFIQNKGYVIDFALNFDMVGRLDPTHKILSIYGINTLNPLQGQWLKSVSFDGQINTQESDKIWEGDLKYWAEKGVPCLSFSTGIHSDYHTINDDEMYINYEGLLLIESYVEKLIRQLTNK